MLVVFDDEIAAVRFLRVARRELDRTGVELPLMVSDRATVNRARPPGSGVAQDRGMVIPALTPRCLGRPFFEGAAIGRT